MDGRGFVVEGFVMQLSARPSLPRPNGIGRWAGDSAMGTLMRGTLIREPP